MNSDLKSALDFAIGYGSVENLEKDYNAGFIELSL